MHDQVMTWEVRVAGRVVGRVRARWGEEQCLDTSAGNVQSHLVMELESDENGRQVWRLVK